MPGITGSTLRRSDGREIWGLGAGTLARAILTLGRSVQSLRLPVDHGDDPAPDGVTAGTIIPGFHAVPGIWRAIKGYGPLLDHLRSPRLELSEVSDHPDAPPGNLLLFPYDWRLSNRYNAQLLRDRTDRALARWRASRADRSEAEVVIIAHSMGGLVARWYLEMLGGAQHTRLLITLGTPFRGAMNSVDQLVNGVKKGLGPAKVDLTDLGRSLPSTYQLLPEYACVRRDGASQLLTVEEASLPGLNPSLVRDARMFHESMNAAAERRTGGCRVVPIVGIRQPTLTIGTISGNRIVPDFCYEGEDLGGDGTVPRLSANPKEMRGDDPMIRGAADGHGHLQTNGGHLDQIEALLTATDRVFKGTLEAGPAVTVADLHAEGESINVGARYEDQLLEAVLFDEQGVQRDVTLVRDGQAIFPAQPEGGYTILVRAPDDPHGTRVPHVSHTTLVWAGE